MKTSLGMGLHPLNTIRLGDSHGSFKLYYFKNDTAAYKSVHK